MLKIFENDNTHLPLISEEKMTDEVVLKQLHEVKKEIAHKTLILGHHYQVDHIINLADVTGDSLALAKEAAKIDRPYIVFCGVHFMAETADMLTGPEQNVILPDLRAGCSMADMANREQIDRAWDFMQSSTNDKIVPITYINCSAELKAFVGKNDGAICTSSNARKIIEWAFDNGEKLLFFPDQHLGRNTCFEMGIPLEEMVVYDPTKQNGGLTREQIKNAKVILWYGYCSVHQGFTAQQITELRKSDPDRKIIVHPECGFDVVQGSDFNGSTSQIIETIENAPAGSKFAVGTEINLVNRLNQRYQDKDIISLSPYQCLCTTMYRIRPRWLLSSFLAIKEDKPINVIKVDPEVKKYSLLALQRMLEI